MGEIAGKERHRIAVYLDPRGVPSATCVNISPFSALTILITVMVAKGVKLIVDTEKSVGGQLGRPSVLAFRTNRKAQGPRGRGQGPPVRVVGADEGH